MSISGVSFVLRLLCICVETRRLIYLDSHADDKRCKGARGIWKSKIFLVLAFRAYRELFHSLLLSSESWDVGVRGQSLYGLFR